MPSANKYLTGSARSDVCAKRRQEPIKEDGPETTIIKTQKLTEHKGQPCTKDYDDVTQKFVNVAIGDYQACLCAESPMPDQTQESTLLNTPWAKALQTTGVNLMWMPQLSRLVSIVLAVAVSCFLCYIDYQPWLASLQRAQDQALPSCQNNIQFSQQPDKIGNQEESCISGRVKRGCELCIQGGLVCCGANL